MPTQRLVNDYISKLTMKRGKYALLTPSLGYNSFLPEKITFKLIIPRKKATHSLKRKSKIYNIFRLSLTSLSLSVWLTTRLKESIGTLESYFVHKRHRWHDRINDKTILLKNKCKLLSSFDMLTSCMLCQRSHFWSIN